VVSVDAGDVRRWLALAPGSRLVDRDPSAIARGLRETLLGSEPVDGKRVRAELSLARIGQLVVGVYRQAIAKRRGTVLEMT
jgi:hypothetical protein